MWVVSCPMFSVSECILKTLYKGAFHEIAIRDVHFTMKTKLCEVHGIIKEGKLKLF